MQSGHYLLLYTVLASFPLLVDIVYLEGVGGSLVFYDLWHRMIKEK